ncbi:ABC transporter substrate-binding protein [Microbacterium sp. BWT-B31]|uniref:ABC transporter substrate-binding protein n=1 Tax=Microbacterium sp. BWT-B31 TaxID=3232072 RepID=UPI003528CF16
MNAPLKRPHRPFVIAALAAASALLLAGCASDPAAPAADAGNDAAGGGILKVGIGAGATCADPQQTFNFSAAAIARSVADSLTDQDPKTGEIVPWLATSWEINDDATQYVFHLRDDVTFSDGTAFDAENVVANLDYIKGLGALSSRGAAFMGNYVGSTAVDEHTVQIDFSSPSAHFLVGTSTLVFSMLSTETTTKTPEERCQGDLVGTGPFVMESYVQDQEAQVVKREGYGWASPLAAHEGDAYLDGITFLFQPVGNVRAGSLTSGQTDVALVLETQDVATITASGAEVMAGTMPGMPGVFAPNLLRDVPADLAVRQAMNVALDRDTIVHTVLGEYYDPAYSIITSNLREYADYSSELGYDPDGAAEILDDAGWKEGSDGVRTKDGKRLAFSITYTEDYGAYYTGLLQLVQQELGEVGMEVTLDNTTQASMIELQQTKDFDFVITTITESDPDMVRNMLSTRVEASVLDSLGLPPLFAAQQAATDPAERSEIWAQIQEIVFDNGLAVPLFEGTQLSGVSANVTGPRYDFKAMITFYDTAFVS